MLRGVRCTILLLLLLLLTPPVVELLLVTAGHAQHNRQQQIAPFIGSIASKEQIDSETSDTTQTPIQSRQICQVMPATLAELSSTCLSQTNTPARQPAAPDPPKGTHV